jgi:hypothetical protein
MGPEAGLTWARAHTIAACYLDTGNDGSVRFSMTKEFAALPEGSKARRPEGQKARRLEGSKARRLEGQKADME